MITPDMLQASQAGGGIALVDVRDAKDFDGELGHVPAARNIPLPELPARIGGLASWRQGAVVLICRTQVCSSQAARLLARLVRHGSSELRVVKGAMQAWRRLDLPDVSVGSVRMIAPGRANDVVTVPPKHRGWIR